MVSTLKAPRKLALESNTDLLVAERTPPPKNKKKKTEASKLLNNLTEVPRLKNGIRTPFLSFLVVFFIQFIR